MRAVRRRGLCRKLHYGGRVQPYAERRLSAAGNDDAVDGGVLGDDFVLLAKRWKDGFLRKVEGILEGRMGLTVNREKTKVVDLDAERASLTFLGYEFRKVRDRLFGTGKRYV